MFVFGIFLEIATVRVIVPQTSREGMQICRSSQPEGAGGRNGIFNAISLQYQVYQYTSIQEKKAGAVCQLHMQQ